MKDKRFSLTSLILVFIIFCSAIFCACSHTHVGGVATCTQKAICSKCKQPYGEILPHSLTNKTARQEFFYKQSLSEDKALYYLSCDCGLKSQQTFEAWNINLGSMLAPNYTWYKGQTPKNKITQITFTDNYIRTNTEIESWDASFNGDKSIMCYVNGSSLTIACNRQLYANYDSGRIFSDQYSEGFSLLTTISGLERLNTKYVLSFIGAFDGCLSLNGTLDLSSWDMSSVITNKAMFQGCGQYANAPLNVILNDTLTIYDDCAFNHNTTYNKTQFFIPKTVKTIGYMHMWYDFGTRVLKPSLQTTDNKIPVFEQFVVDNDSPYFKAVDGVLYSKDGSRLISVPVGKTFADRTFAIPEGVTWINELAFDQTKQIDTLVLPNSYVITPYICPATHPDKTLNSGSSLNVAIYCYTTINYYQVKQDNPNYISVNGCLYSKDGSKLIAVPLHYKGELNIVEGTSSIEKEAWWADEDLSLQNSFTNSAMNDINNLTKIRIPSTVTFIEEGQLRALNYLMSRKPYVVEISSQNASYKIINNKIVKI